jgi:predicted site-specific integrase-resolvase
MGGLSSGLNDKRPELIKLLQDVSTGKIVVEYSDRQTRFGFNYIDILYQGEIVVINQVDDDKEDLMRDFVSSVTSFVAELYGLRISERKTERLIKELKNDKKINCKS